MNALDRLKVTQERKLNEHNRKVQSFEQLLIDFMVRHDIHNQ